MGSWMSWLSLDVIGVSQHTGLSNNEINSVQHTVHLITIRTKIKALAKTHLTQLKKINALAKTQLTQLEMLKT